MPITTPSVPRSDPGDHPHEWRNLGGLEGVAEESVRTIMGGGSPATLPHLTEAAVR